MRALVVGGTGPTGPLVIAGLLERGYQVTILHRGVHEVELPAEIEHLHADPHFSEDIQDALGSRTFDLVIGMYGRLRHVAEAMKGRTPRFIGIAGLPYKILYEPESCLDPAPVPIPEDAPLFLDPDRQKMIYLMSISEEAVFEAHRQGHYNATLLRYPNVYGPRQVQPREWSIMRRVLDGRKQLIVPDRGLKLETRGYYKHQAHAVLLTVDHPRESSGQVYNTGDETTLSVRDWINTVARAMNHQFELVNMPFELARPSRPYAGRSVHHALDLTKIRTDLGYRQLIPTEQAIQQTVQWYLEHPIERDGELERKQGDSFNYAVEDRLIHEFKAMREQLRAVGDVGYFFYHAMPHPKKVGGTTLRREGPLEWGKIPRDERQG